MSPAGGTEPAWAKSGATLFYRRGRGIYRVAIGDDGSSRPAAGAPEHLFDGAFLADPLGNLPAYDVGDGSRLVMLQPAGRPETIRVLGGWQAAVFSPPGTTMSLRRKAASEPQATISGPVETVRPRSPTET